MGERRGGIGERRKRNRPARKVEKEQKGIERKIVMMVVVVVSL